jgi:hypothetical protein
VRKIKCECCILYFDVVKQTQRQMYSLGHGISFFCHFKKLRCKSLFIVKVTLKSQILNLFSVHVSQPKFRVSDCTRIFDVRTEGLQILFKKFQKMESQKKRHSIAH